MIISRTPFRVSFIGGGTDLPSFYQVEAGAVMSTAINKYIYITVNKRFDDTIRVSYSRTEIVNDVEEIQHPIVREALKLTQVTKGVEVVSIADVPGGTGLGSSGSFTVGLLNALYAYKEIFKPAEALAREACHIEIDILGEPVGKQDQYIAAYGGLRYIQFNPDGTVFNELITYTRENKEKLNQNLLLFYTGGTRDARSILREQGANIKQSDKMELYKEMRNLASELRDCLNNSSSPDTLGEFLHRGWMLKRQLANGISSNEIDNYYEKALSAGALGGKITGAGGGGFLLLYCPQEKQLEVRKALNQLPLMKFSLEPEGSKIVYIV